MIVHTVSSAQLDADADAVMRLAAEGAVVIIEDGKPAHVLLRYHDYEKLMASEQGRGSTAADATASAPEP